MKLHHLSLGEVQLALQKKEFSAAELNQYFTDRIDKFQPQLNAIATKAAANQYYSLASQKKPADSPKTSPLKDIPVIHKDVFCTKGLTTTAASNILKNFIPPYSAHIVEELANAGTATIAKANMDEFAMGSSNENSAFGVCRNPWQVEYSPGGSSGGSAVCVSAGMSLIATGSDTGGSIRTPASHCGVTGIKPSYGTVSRYGVIAYASSLDQAGVFARRAEDCANALEVMMNFDERDSTQIPINERGESGTNLTATLENDIRGKKIGVCYELINRADPALQAAINNAIKKYNELGAIPVEIELKYLDEALSAYYIIATAEASSNLSRYDGIRYGHRTASAKKLEDIYAKSRAEGFGMEVKRRILLGTFVLSHGYYDAYYLSALKVRRLIVNMFADIFSKCDVLALPVSPLPPVKIGSIVSPIEDYLMDVYTVPINLAGLPAMSIPVGKTADNLPIGLQLTSAYFGEAKLLNFAHQFQKVSDFHLQYPADFD